MTRKCIECHCFKNGCLLEEPNTDATYLECFTETDAISLALIKYNPYITRYESLDKRLKPLPDLEALDSQHPKPPKLEEVIYRAPSPKLSILTRLSRLYRKVFK